mgnify:CR=1 FL=1
MTPKRKQVFISSLGLCTASWLFPVDGSAAVTTSVQSSQNPLDIEEQIVEEALYRYYNPFASLENIKPLKQSKQPLQYKIKQGDTLSEIAKQFDLSTQQLANFNRIRDIDSITAGKTLQIPYRSKQIRVADGRNLASLAEQYNVSKALIKKLNPELEKTDEKMYIGQVVTIPRRIKITQPEPATRQKKNSVQLASRATSNRSTSEFKGNFAWPVGGQLTSPYGNRNGRLHRGIDIWNEQEGNAPVKAAATGVVSRAGYAGNYGNLIVIDHGDGWSTYYAHLRTLQVSKGETVSSGQQIGYIGNTGNSTGYHLHFEVRKDGENVDPMSVLP